MLKYGKKCENNKMLNNLIKFKMYLSKIDYYSFKIKLI